MAITIERIRAEKKDTLMRFRYLQKLWIPWTIRANPISNIKTNSTGNPLRYLPSRSAKGRYVKFDQSSTEKDAIVNIFTAMKIIPKVKPSEIDSTILLPRFKVIKRHSFFAV